MGMKQYVYLHPVQTEASAVRTAVQLETSGKGVICLGKREDFDVPCRPAGVIEEVSSVAS